jgi:tetratricopeptide (TPR) repeat protein
MADKKATQSTEEAEVVIRKAQDFWDKYSKPITYVGSAIIIIIAAWYGYLFFIKNPNEQAAAKMIFPAEGLFGKMATTGFNKDSVNIVLNGGSFDGGNVSGLLKVISKYGGTGAGNRARYMAGACYLQIGEFDKAIKYLKEFDSHGADQLESRAYIMLGHAYSEKNNKEDALSYYEKAASVNEKDEALSSDALMMAATYASVVGNDEKAIALFKELKEKYPNSTPAKSGEADKYLAKMGILK